MIKKIIYLLMFVFILQPIQTKAAVEACNPLDAKPESAFTRLGSFDVTPDIVPVNSSITALIHITSSDISNVNIEIPKSTEAIDWSPRVLDNGTAKAGSWTGALPVGDYKVTLKSTHYTKGKWQKISYNVTNTQGLGEGYSYFFSYYDKMSLSINLNQRNEVSQTTNKVVRKVTVQSPPDVKINLKTNKGNLGTTVGAETGQSINLIANSSGVSTGYLFANEGQKVELTTESDDSCQDSKISQTFKVERSDVGRNIDTNYLWIWWLILILIIVGAILFFIFKRKKQNNTKLPQDDVINTSQQTQDNQSFLELNNVPGPNSDNKNNDAIPPQNNNIKEF